MRRISMAIVCLLAPFLSGCMAHYNGEVVKTIHITQGSRLTSRKRG